MVENLIRKEEKMFKKETPKIKSFKEAASYYSLVTKAGPFLFVAGQIAYDPERDIVIKGYRDLPDEEGRNLATGRTHTDEREGRIIAQSWFIFNNIKKILEELGSSIDNIVYTHIYMVNMDRDFAPFERVRMMFMKKDPPASTVLEVPRIGVNDDCLIEYEPIALVNE
jgi:enamine deaminase RidA (YjgF/YER057c/UK114 family)